MKSHAKDCKPRAEFQSRMGTAFDIGVKSARFGLEVHIGSLSKNLGAQVDPNKLSWSSVPVAA